MSFDPMETLVLIERIVHHFAILEFNMLNCRANEVQNRQTQ